MNRVSIIIPCYNGEATVARTLDSVLRQTHRDFEALVIDDGSTDRSAEIVSAYAAADSRIRLLRKKNGGVSSARNFGLEQVTGDFVAFLDADDELFPENLEVMTQTILRTGSDACACNFTGNPMFHSYLTDRVYDLTGEEGFLEFYQETFGIMVPWNKMYRRECVHARFDEEVRFNEDELFGLTQLTYMKQIASVSDVLYIYHTPEPKPASEGNSGSCVDRNARVAAFWENRTGIWYTCRDLIPRRRRILEDAIARGRQGLPPAERLLYVRSTDIMFWELSLYSFIGIPREGLRGEVLSVLPEPETRRGFEALARCGVRYHVFEGEELRRRGERFADLCANAQRDILAHQPGTAFPKVFFGIFIRLFCEEAGQPLLPLSPVSRMQAELRAGVSPEARYVLALLPEAAVCAGI